MRPEDAICFRHDYSMVSGGTILCQCFPRFETCCHLVSRTETLGLVANSSNQASRPLALCAREAPLRILFLRRFTNARFDWLIEWLIDWSDRSQVRWVRLCCSLEPTTFYWVTTWVCVALAICDAVVTVSWSQCGYASPHCTTTHRSSTPDIEAWGSLVIATSYQLLLLPACSVGPWVACCYEALHPFCIAIFLSVRLSVCPFVRVCYSEKSKTKGPIVREQKVTDSWHFAELNWGRPMLQFGWIFWIGKWFNIATHLVVVFLLVVGATLFKKRKATLFQIGAGWNLAVLMNGVGFSIWRHT